MGCIQAPTEETRQQRFDIGVRNEIVRDLVTHMFSFHCRPSRDFCTKAAKMLIQKYSFMAEKGKRVSGYVSALLFIWSQLIQCYLFLGFLGKKDN